jgi:hypothetical protein
VSEPATSTFVTGVPRGVRDPGECFFYHEMELPASGRQRGVWNLIGRFDDYVAGTNLARRTVLDVGTASGFLTFEAERRGAVVTSLDAGDPDQIDQLPHRDGDYVRDYPRWRANAAEWLERMQNSYWLSHHEFGSRATCIYGDVYRLEPTVGIFDVVIVGQILVHLRDGLTALTAAASVCRETIVITEGSFDNPTPIAALSGRAARPELPYTWYQYSYGWYREVLAMLGFSTVEITTGTYPCHDEIHENTIELTTIVGRR